MDDDVLRRAHDAVVKSIAQRSPLGRIGKTSEIGKVAAFLASDASSFTTGALLAVDGGAQWSLAGGGEQTRGYQSIYDGRRDWS